MNKGLGQLLEMIRQSQALQEAGEPEVDGVVCWRRIDLKRAIPTNSASSLTAARSTLWDIGALE
jgi:hypothetical protein